MYWRNLGDDGTSFSHETNQWTCNIQAQRNDRKKIKLLNINILMMKKDIYYLSPTHHICTNKGGGNIQPPQYSLIFDQCTSTTHAVHNFPLYRSGRFSVPMHVKMFWNFEDFLTYARKLIPLFHPRLLPGDKTCMTLKRNLSPIYSLRYFICNNDIIIYKYYHQFALEILH